MYNYLFLIIENFSQKKRGYLIGCPLVALYNWILLFLLYLEADFAVDAVLSNFAIFDRCTSFVNIDRLDAPEAFRSFVQGVLSGIFPALTRAGHDFYYFDYHVVGLKVLDE